MARMSCPCGGAAVVKWTAPPITLEKVLKVTEHSEAQTPELEKAEV
jgi:hypothetical protein